MAGIMRWLIIGGTTESVDAVKYLVSGGCYRLGGNRYGSSPLR
ncbi:MAG: hypothetical protein ACLTSO_11460 [Coprococcus sp.]